MRTQAMEDTTSDIIFFYTYYLPQAVYVVLKIWPSGSSSILIIFHKRYM